LSYMLVSTSGWMPWSRSPESNRAMLVGTRGWLQGAECGCREVVLLLFQRSEVARPHERQKVWGDFPESNRKCV